MAIRDAYVNGRLVRIGYELQYFTSPQHRRMGVASKLHRAIYTVRSATKADLPALVDLTVVCEKRDPMMKAFKGFTTVGTCVHLFAKPLAPALVLGEGPLMVDVIDL